MRGIHRREIRAIAIDRISRRSQVFYVGFGVAIKRAPRHASFDVSAQIRTTRRRRLCVIIVTRALTLGPRHGLRVVHVEKIPTTLADYVELHYVYYYTTVSRVRRARSAGLAEEYDRLMNIFGIAPQSSREGGHPGRRSVPSLARPLPLPSPHFWRWQPLPALPPSLPPSLPPRQRMHEVRPRPPSKAWHGLLGLHPLPSCFLLH